jgi:RNA polymerase sigma-70 factor, ECF subfamily
LVVENTNYVDYLISLSKEGRTRSFIDLCEINLRNIYSVIFRLICDSKAAASLSIYTFLKAWERLSEYENNTSFALWLKKLAIIYSIIDLNQNPRNIPFPQNKKNIKSDLEFLDAIIASLPPDERIIFVLHDLEGYSYEDIAKSFVENMMVDEIRSKLIKTREYIVDKLNK